MLAGGLLWFGVVAERAARLVEQLQEASNALMGVVERVCTNPQA
jgi:hypothetical protein